MSTALKPAITSTPSGPQPAPVPTQINKQLPSQNASSYGQNSTHLSQNLVTLSQNTQSNVHNQPNHTNHYSLNVPNASHLTNTNQTNFSIPTTLPNVSTTTYTNSTESSILPATQPISCSPEKPQSNGTPDLSTTVTTTTATTTTAATTTTMSSNLQQNHIPQETEKVNPQQLSNTEIVKEEKSPVAVTKEQNHTKEKPESTQTVLLSTTSDNKSDDKETTDSVSDVEENEIIEKVEADSVEESPTSTEGNTPTKKEQNIVTTPKSSMKATRILRKIKPTKPEEIMKKLDNMVVVQQKLPSMSRKSKRNRTTAQPFQYPLPEIEIISKIASTSHRHKNDDDKLIIFYNKEFLAVRNSEGTFYVCQAVQNIYKRSPRIRIRWLSQDKNDKTGELYTPDFYDHIDFDCILTNLQLERVNKGKYKLPRKEQERTDSILKRSLAVEKGDETPGSLTEEHPDGLDLSLYKEESQLKKRKAMKRKASSLKSKAKGLGTSKSVDNAKLRKIVGRTLSKSSTIKHPVATTSKKMPDIKKTNTSSGRSERAKRRSDNSSSDSSPVVDQKKARVLAKIGRKAAVTPTKISHKTYTKRIVSTKQQKVVASTSQAATTTRKTKRTRK